MKKYIIFDFDGTLVNTNDVIIDSWQATYEKFRGERIDVRDIEKNFGEMLLDTVRREFPDEDPDTIRRFYRDYQATRSDVKVHVFDGVRELLEKLREKGYVIGIATSRTEKSFREYMSQMGLGDYFDGFVAMEHVAAYKPDPEAVLLLLDRLGGTPEEAIMIGDTKYDIGCAVNAGIDSVLIGWSHYIDEDALKASGYEPTYRIGSPEDLLGLL